MLASMATRMDFLVSNSSLVGGRVKKTLQTRFVGRIEVKSRKIGQKLCAFCRKLNRFYRVCHLSTANVPLTTFLGHYRQL